MTNYKEMYDQVCSEGHRLALINYELLEACKEVLDIISSYSQIPAQMIACSILKQAIAKATLDK